MFLKFLFVNLKKWDTYQRQSEQQRDTQQPHDRAESQLRTKSH